MQRIDTLTDLRQAWQAISGALSADLGATWRLARDPVGTLKALGYEISEDARTALLSSLPGY
jgi:hypothetical protein